MTCRITYLFKGGRRSRIQDKRLHPDDLFYGCTLLKGDVRIIEQEDTGYDGGGRFVRILDRLSGPVYFSLGFAACLARVRRELNAADVLVATTNTYGLALGLLSRFRLLRVPVIFLAMGLLPRGSSRWRRLLFRFLLKGIDVCVISKAEQKFLEHSFCRRITYLPFGVDATFWQPGGEPASFVFSMGNDENRDFDLLASVWKEHYPELVIVTARNVPSRPNIRVIRGDYRANIVSDEEILRMYQQALFVIVPSKETIQPAGQSVTLQAMACGKTVILPRISGLWDSGLMVSGETCLLYEPGNAKDLEVCIDRAIEGASLPAIGQQARAVVERELTSAGFAAALQTEISRLTGKP